MNQSIRPIRLTQGRPEEFEGRQAWYKKGFVNIVVIIGVVILAGVVSYFFVSQRVPSAVLNQRF